MIDMRVYFPGGKKVFADFNKFTHKTDQPIFAGGEGTAPSPFELFLASLGTCAGIYILGFCQQRNIDTKGIEIIQTTETNPQTRMVEKVNLEVKLPVDFPEKYRTAVVQAASLCAVKKHLENPPDFNVYTS